MCEKCEVRCGSVGGVRALQTGLNYKDTKKPPISIPSYAHKFENIKLLGIHLFNTYKSSIIALIYRNSSSEPAWYNQHQ